MREIDAILRDILEIVAYTSDKEVFINEFSMAVLQQAFAELCQTMPKEKRKHLGQQLFREVVPQEAEAILTREIDTDLYKKQVSKTTNQVFFEYVQAISPTLSLQQRERLQKYLKSKSHILG